MAEFAMNFNYYQQATDMFPSLPRDDTSGIIMTQKPNDPPPPPPIIICPTEVDSVNITLEKNQQCACKDCGKLFNSVWYLKQHAVKHSNDRPFKCKFCFKTYKFRSNLYQHKCPDRQKQMGQSGRRRGGIVLSPSARRLETNQLLKSRIEANMSAEELAAYQCGSTSDNEDNDIPITYGLVIQRFDDVPYTAPPSIPQSTSVHENTSTTTEKPNRIDCVRERQLSQEEIEAYVMKNKSKLHTCRKCRLMFPTEASLMRHSAAHSRDDMFPYKCSNCRQVFEFDRELRRHSQVHSGIGPWRCEECCGMFRSSVALRRHHDQCRQCYVPPIQNEIMVSVHSPFDAYSFIPSEGDNLFMPSVEDLSRKGPDSGLGSEASPISYNHTSPDRSTLPLDVDTFDLFAKKKEKEDDEDSGFRSRVNSVTQSCSPGSSSAFSSDGGSPKRKMSGSEGGESATSNYSLGALGYGTGPTYGQQLFHPFDQAVGGDDGSLNFSVPQDEIMKFLVTSFSTMLRPDAPLSRGIAVAMRPNYPVHKICKDFYVEQTRSSNYVQSDFLFSDPFEWKESHNVDYALSYEKWQDQQISTLLISILRGELIKAICAAYVSLIILLLACTVQPGDNQRN